MSIPSFIKKVCVQTAVYWGNPVSNGYGGFTYDEPTEIKCRWEDKQKIISNHQGEEIISNTEVMVNDSSIFSVGDVLFLGMLEDIYNLELGSESEFAYLLPDQILNSHRVVAQDIIPLFRSTTKFIRVLYLKPNWETKL